MTGGSVPTQPIRGFPSRSFAAEFICRAKGPRMKKIACIAGSKLSEGQQGSSILCQKPDEEDEAQESGARSSDSLHPCVPLLTSRVLCNQNHGSLIKPNEAAAYVVVDSPADTRNEVHRRDSVVARKVPSLRHGFGSIHREGAVGIFSSGEEESEVLVHWASFFEPNAYAWSTCDQPGFLSTCTECSPS